MPGSWPGQSVAGAESSPALPDKEVGPGDVGASRELYGILQAAPETRRWLPYLGSEGQRLVLSVLTLHVESEHSLASPSAVDLAAMCGYHPQSVRRILGQLEEVGVLTCVGSRPVYSLNGTAHGGRIRVWAVNSAPAEITNSASKGLLGNESHARPGSLPSAPWKPPNSASEGARLKDLKDLKAPAADLSLFEGSSAAPRCPIHRRALELSEDGSNLCVDCEQENTR